MKTTHHSCIHSPSSPLCFSRKVIFHDKFCHHRVYLIISFLEKVFPQVQRLIRREGWSCLLGEMCLLALQSGMGKVWELWFSCTSKNSGVWPKNIFKVSHMVWFNNYSIICTCGFNPGGGFIKLLLKFELLPPLSRLNRNNSLH